MGGGHRSKKQRDGNSQYNYLYATFFLQFEKMNSFTTWMPHSTSNKDPPFMNPPVWQNKREIDIHAISSAVAYMWWWERAKIYLHVFKLNQVSVWHHLWMRWAIYLLFESVLKYPWICQLAMRLHDKPENKCYIFKSHHMHMCQRERCILNQKKNKCIFHVYFEVKEQWEG